MADRAMRPLLVVVPDTGGLRRNLHRNGQSAEQPRPSPPIARCSHRAHAPISPLDPGLYRMNNGGQVSADPFMCEPVWGEPRVAKGRRAVRVSVLPDAAAVLRHLPGLFEGYNTVPLHPDLRMLSPREFIAESA